jgi:hypothetical protein
LHLDKQALYRLKSLLENNLQQINVIGQPLSEQTLRLSVEAANALSPLTGPKAVNALGMKNPFAFNRAGDSPPRARMEKIGHLGAHTFHGFKQGRE